MTPLLTATGQTKNTKQIHVLIWDERQPKQAVAYKDFLGNEIAKRLTDQTSDFEVRSVALDDADQGLTAGNLEWADVIIWWGHVRQSEVPEEKARSDRGLHTRRKVGPHCVALGSLGSPLHRGNELAQYRGRQAALPTERLER